MKRPMIFILMVIIILSVAACTKNVEKSSETNLSTEEPTKNNKLDSDNGSSDNFMTAAADSFDITYDNLGFAKGCNRIRMWCK